MQIDSCVVVLIVNPENLDYRIVHRSWGQNDSREGLEKERLEDSLLPKLVQVS